MVLVRREDALGRRIRGRARRPRGARRGLRLVARREGKSRIGGGLPCPDGGPVFGRDGRSHNRRSSVLCGSIVHESKLVQSGISVCSRGACTEATEQAATRVVHSGQACGRGCLASEAVQTKSGWPGTVRSGTQERQRGSPVGRRPSPKYRGREQGHKSIPRPNEASVGTLPVRYVRVGSRRLRVVLGKRKPERRRADDRRDDGQERLIAVAVSVHVQAGPRPGTWRLHHSARGACGLRWLPTWHTHVPRTQTRPRRVPGRAQAAEGTKGSEIWLYVYITRLLLIDNQGSHTHAGTNAHRRHDELLAVALRLG